MVGRVKAHTQNARAENERTENARTENKEHENTERISTSVGTAFNERWSKCQRVVQGISVGGGALSTNYIDPFFSNESIWFVKFVPTCKDELQLVKVRISETKLTNFAQRPGTRAPPPSTREHRKAALGTQERRNAPPPTSRLPFL